MGTLGLLLKFLLHCLDYFGFGIFHLFLPPHICKQGFWNVLIRVHYQTIKTFYSLCSVNTSSYIHALASLSSASAVSIIDLTCGKL